MRHSARFFKFMLATAGCVAALSCQAQISKCIDSEGRISYSDNACGNAVLVGYVIDSTPSMPAETPPARTVSRRALDNVAMRETAWAQTPPKTRVGSRDAATISEARQTLMANERALSFMRTEKVASNH